MKTALSAWMRTVAGAVPFRVGTALLVGAWLALTMLFTIVGNVLVLSVTTALGQLGPVSLVLVVFGVFGTPALSMVLAQNVVAAAVERLELVVRDGNATPDSRGAGSREVHSSGSGSSESDPCEATDRVHCRTRCC